MKHRHKGPKVKYRRKDRTRFRKRPLHKYTYKVFKQPKTTLKIPLGNYVAQEKFDGVRTLFIDDKNKAKFINRRNVDKTKQYLELHSLAKKIPGTNVIDGEIVAFNKKGKDDFKLLAQRDHLKYKEDIKRKSQEIPLTFIAFDILNHKGKNIRHLSWKERNKILTSLPKSKHFKIIKSYPKEKAKNILRDKSVEGVIFKKTDSVYDNKKDDNWLKKKQANEADVFITGYEEGTGKRKGAVGALHIGILKKGKIKEVGKVGTGFTEKEAKDLKRRLDKKERLFAKVNYLKLGSQGRLREPSFKSLRTDIKLKETHI